MTSQFLDRLARSEALDSWPPDELAAALAMVEELDVGRRQSDGKAQVIDLRLAIYRRRLRYEMDQRAARDEDIHEP
jgi:hypothetical protein